MKAFCRSVNVHEVVVLCSGGGDTSTLHVVIKLFLLQVVETLKPSIQYASLPFTPFAPLCPLTPCLYRGGGDPKT